MWLLLLLFAVLYGLGLKAYEEGKTRDLMRTLSQPLARVFVVLAALFGFKFAYNLGLHYLVRYLGGHITHDWNLLLAYAGYREDLGHSCLVPGGIEEQYVDRLTLPAYYFNRRCVGNQAGYAAFNQPIYSLWRYFLLDSVFVAILVERSARLFLGWTYLIPYLSISRGRARTSPYNSAQLDTDASTNEVEDGTELTTIELTHRPHNDDPTPSGLMASEATRISVLESEIDERSIKMVVMRDLLMEKQTRINKLENERLTNNDGSNNKSGDAFEVDVERAESLSEKQTLRRLLAEQQEAFTRTKASYTSELRKLQDSSYAKEAKIEEMQRCLTNAEPVSETTRDELASAKKQLEILLEKTESDATLIKECEERITFFEYQELENAKMILARNSALKAMTEKSDERLRKVEELELDLVQHKSRLRNQIKENSGKTEAQTNLTKAEKGVKKLMKVVGTLQAKLTAKRRENEKLSEGIKKLDEKEKTPTQASYLASARVKADQTIKDLTDELNDAIEARDTFEDAVDELCRKLEQRQFGSETSDDESDRASVSSYEDDGTAKKEAMGLRGQMAFKDMEIKELERSLGEMTAKLTHKEQTINDLSREQQLLQKQLEQSKALLNATPDEKNRQVATLNEALTRTRTEFADYVATEDTKFSMQGEGIKQLRDTQTQLQNEIQNLREKLQRRDDIILQNPNSSAIHAQSEAIEMLELKLQDSSKAIIELESTLERVTKSNTTSIETLRLQLLAANRSCASLSRQIDLMTQGAQPGGHESMVKKLTKMETQKILMDKLLKEAHEEQNDTAKKLQDCRIMLAQAQTTNAGLKIDQDERSKNLAEIARLENVKDVLSKIMSEDQVLLNLYKAEIHDLTARIDVLNAEPGRSERITIRVLDTSDKAESSAKANSQKKKKRRHSLEEMARCRDDYELDLEDMRSDGDDTEFNDSVTSETGQLGLEEYIRRAPSLGDLKQKSRGDASTKQKSSISTATKGKLSRGTTSAIRSTSDVQPIDPVQVLEPADPNQGLALGDSMQEFELEDIRKDSQPQTLVITHKEIQMPTSPSTTRHQNSSIPRERTLSLGRPRVLSLSAMRSPKSGQRSLPSTPKSVTFANSDRADPDRLDSLSYMHERNGRELSLSDLQRREIIDIIHPPTDARNSLGAMRRSSSGAFSLSNMRSPKEVTFVGTGERNLSSSTALSEKEELYSAQLELEEEIKHFTEKFPDQDMFITGRNSTTSQKSQPSVTIELGEKSAAERAEERAKAKAIAATAALSTPIRNSTAKSAFLKNGFGGFSLTGESSRGSTGRDVGAAHYATSPSPKSTFAFRAKEHGVRVEDAGEGSSKSRGLKTSMWKDEDGSKDDGDL